MGVKLLQQEFDPWQEIRHYQAHIDGTHGGGYGATAVFVGTMRDFNAGDQVKGMFLEHYPGMTERELTKIEQQARERWDVLDILILHRVGHVQPNDSIVLTVVWSAHRADAFAANRFLMEELKSRAPFWKKETLAHEKSRWVAGNTPG